MPQSLDNLIRHLKPYWLDSAAAIAGIELNKIILFPSTTTPAIFYSKTAAGLAAALIAVTAGSEVRINGPCTLTGDFEIPAGAELRANPLFITTIVGTITMNESSYMENLTIAAVANDANALYGVIGPQTGTAKIKKCHITATQSGAGNAYAIGATRGASSGNGNLDVKKSYLNGISVGGSGYAARSTRGKIDIWHGQAYGSTARYIQV
jgi:hypothetical protein